MAQPLINASLRRAHVAFSAGAYDMALQEFNAALNMAEQNAPHVPAAQLNIAKEQLASILCNIGSVYDKKKRPNQSLRIYTQSKGDARTGSSRLHVW